MGIKIFVFDWTGTLDTLDDPVDYLCKLRERWSGCKIVINSASPNVPPAVLDVVDDRQHNEGSIQDNIIKPWIKDFMKDHWRSREDAILLADLDEIIIIDNEPWILSLVESMRIHGRYPYMRAHACIDENSLLSLLE